MFTCNRYVIWYIVRELIDSTALMIVEDQGYHVYKHSYNNIIYLSHLLCFFPPYSARDSIIHNKILASLLTRYIRRSVCPDRQLNTVNEEIVMYCSKGALALVVVLFVCSARAREFQFLNNLPGEVWIGSLGNANKPPLNNGGWRLGAGQRVSFTIKLLIYLRE